jgi:hypothetical protein
MPWFEFKIVQSPTERALNELGREGYQVVATLANSPQPSHRIVMQREVVEDAEKTDD